MRLFWTQPVANGSTIFTFPKGQWGAILVVFDVVTSAGNTATLASCGNARLTWGGEDLKNCSIELLNLINNLYGGVMEATFAAASANRISCVILPGLAYDSKSVFDVGANDNVTLTLDWTALAALCASGSIKIYLKPKIGTMSYVHKILPQTIIAQAAGVIPGSLPVNNVSEIFLLSPAAQNVTGIQITKDNDTIVDSVTVADLDAYNNFIHVVETAQTKLLAIDFGESKDIHENVGAAAQFRYTFSAAGTLQQFYGFISFTNNKLIESVASGTANLNNKVRRSVTM
jgi:hypothetical protein